MFIIIISNIVLGVFVILLDIELFFLQIHLEPMYIGDKGQQLPCRFYDVPGIDQKRTLTDVELQDLQEIIDGKMILDVDVSASKITLTF